MRLIDIDKCSGMDLKLCQIADEIGLSDEQYRYFTKGWRYLWGLITKLPEEYKWIPVIERLPESGMTEDECFLKYVLIQDEHGDMHLAHYDKEMSWVNGWFMVDRKSDDFKSEVIAWMSLPEPYKDGETK